VAAAILADGREPGRAGPHGDVQLAGFRFIRESLVFYTGRPIQYCKTPEQLARFLRESPKAYVVTVDEHVDDLAAQYPGEFREVARRRRFLHPGEVVVLTRRADSNIPRTAGRMDGSMK
jgi:hypothetical protein